MDGLVTALDYTVFKKNHPILVFAVTFNPKQILTIFGKDVGKGLSKVKIPTYKRTKCYRLHWLDLIFNSRHFRLIRRFPL